MNLRAVRRSTLLALVAPALVAVPSGAAHATPSTPAVVAAEHSSFGPTLPEGHVYRQVAVGFSMSYGLTLAGTIEAAGYFGDALTPPSAPEGTTWVQIAAGASHGLALDSAGHVATWGVASDQREVPATVPDDIADLTLSQVAAGNHHDLGLTTDGRVVGWGNPTNQAETAVPTALTEADPIDPVTSITTSYGVSAAVTASGVLYAWGGLLGPEPDGLADETVVDASAGSGHLLVLTADGDLYDWGYYAAGAPPEELAGQPLVDIDAGNLNRSAAVTADGDVYIWGSGEGSLPTLRTDVQATGVDLDRYRSGVTYAALANTTLPTISGTPEFGTELTATQGGWNATPDEVHYQWHVGSQDVGTDSATYTPVADDLDSAVTVTVTATLDGYVGTSATSAETDPVARLQFTTAPTITIEGEARVGQTLTAVRTDAVPEPDAYEYSWYTVVLGDEPEDDEWIRIDDATSSTLEITPDLVGSRIVVAVAATKVGYQAEWPSSEPTDPVAAAPVTHYDLVNTGPPTISGTPRFGETLTATAGEWNATPDDVHYQWHVGTRDVGTDSATYTPAADDVDSTVTVTVTADRAGFTSASATSAGTDPVERLHFATTPTVTVTGTPRVGQVLTATAVTDPMATATTYQWLQDGAPISGATTRTYRAVAADLGAHLRVRVTSTAAGYEPATAVSEATHVTAGPATLKVKVPARVVIGKKAKITVTGLTAGERFVVTFDGRERAGRATGAGVGTVKLKVTGKPGRRTVTVVGSYPDRTGTTHLRAVRHR